MSKSNRVSAKKGEIDSLIGTDLSYKNSNFTNITGLSASLSTLDCKNALFDTIYATSIQGNFIDDFKNISGQTFSYTNGSISNKLTLGYGSEQSPSLVFKDDKNGIYYDDPNQKLVLKINNNSNFLSEKLTTFNTVLQAKSVRQSVLTITNPTYTISQSDIDNYGIIYFDNPNPSSTTQIFLPKFNSTNYVGSRIVLINGKVRESVGLQVNRQTDDYLNGSKNCVITYNNRYVIEIFVAKIENTESSTYSTYFFSD